MPHVVHDREPLEAGERVTQIARLNRERLRGRRVDIMAGPTDTLGHAVSTDIDPRTVRPALAAGVADEALEEINRLWTIVRAFSNAAHDVNNDLQVIAGNAELLAGRELDPTVRRRVQAIREQAVAPPPTFNRPLSYSRSDPAAPAAVDACQVLAEAVAMRRSSLHRARIAVTSEPAPQPCWAV